MHEAPRHRRRRVHRLHLRPHRRRRSTRSSCSTSSPTPAARRTCPRGRELIEGAIEDPKIVREAMEGVDAVVNFAAESHVDRSIDDQDAFARTHVIGTGTLLDAARELGVERYLQVSTDEVYGSIDSGSFTETSPLDPSSPYSATKAAGDLLVGAHVHTYGIEASIVRGSNNYGPRQYPEKLIPLIMLNALHGDPLPVYGDGKQVRNWLYVEDFCRGIHTVLMNGKRRRGLQRRRPGRVREHRGRQAGHRADRQRRVADRVRQGPPRPRPPLLARLRQAAATSSAGRPRSTSPRASRKPSTGTATTRTGGARSAPASTASTTKSSTGRPSAADAGAAADEARRRRPAGAGRPRRRARLHGRDLQPRRLGRAGGRRRVRPAQPLALLQGHPARHPLPDRAGTGEAGPLRARGDPRRRRRPAPRLATYGQWEAHVLDDERHRQLFVPVGFGHGFAVLSDVADVAYLVSSLYDPADRGRDRLGRPRRRRRLAGRRAAAVASATKAPRSSPKSPRPCRSNPLMGR